MNKLNNAFFERIIFMMLAGAFLLVLILRITLAFSFIPETGGVSVNVMYALQHFVKTGQLYSNPELPPFSIVQYMPLHYYLVAPVIKLLNTNHDIHSTMMIHRFFCLLCDIVSLIVIIVNSKKLFPSVSLLNSINSALLFILLIPGICFARVDSLYLLLFIIAVFSFLFFLKNKNENRNLFYCAVFTGLALVTKQTAVFLLGFIFLYLIFIFRKPKTAIIYFSISFFPLLVFLLFIIPSAADFKLNVIDGVKNGFSSSWFIEVFIKNFFLKYSFLLAFGIYLGIYLLKSAKSSIAYFIGIAICFFLSTAFILSLKASSGPNYYLEFIFFTILAVLYILNEHPSLSINYFRFTAILIPFILLVCMNDKGWSYLSYLKKNEKDYEQCLKIDSYIETRLKPGEYILSAFHKENCLNLLLSQYALFPCREVALYYTYPLGVFKFSEFKNLVKEKKVTYYIDEKGNLPGKFLNADLSKMQADTTIANYILYKTTE